MKVTDAQLVTKIVDFIDNVDADAISEIASLMFGVNCVFDEESMKYEITPNENYCEAFGPL